MAIAAALLMWTMTSSNGFSKVELQVGMNDHRKRLACAAYTSDGRDAFSSCGFGCETAANGIREGRKTRTGDSFCRRSESYSSIGTSDFREFFGDARNRSDRRGQNCVITRLCAYVSCTVFERTTMTALLRRGVIGASLKVGCSWTVARPSSAE